MPPGRVSKAVQTLKYRIHLNLNLSIGPLRTNFIMAATKVALITASSAGLGAQIARAFAPDFRVVSIPMSRSPGYPYDML